MKEVVLVFVKECRQKRAFAVLKGRRSQEDFFLSDLVFSRERSMKEKMERRPFQRSSEEIFEPHERLLEKIDDAIGQSVGRPINAGVQIAARLADDSFDFGERRGVDQRVGGLFR